jgi:hypothetical protein
MFQAFYALINLAAYLLEGIWILAAPLFGYRYQAGMEKVKMI